MVQIADAIVTGFAKSPLLIERSFAPLRQLNREGLLRAIHYVTWDSPDLDAFVAPIKKMADVQITRVPQPQAEGTTAQRNLVFQIANLKAGLGLVGENNAVILKTRPDFVANVDFLREKLKGYELDCAIDRSSIAHGVRMPKPVFTSKIWVPWADSNQPFFYEDAAFMGRKIDLLKLVTPLTAADLAMAAIPSCSHYVHIVRFAKIFLQSQPLFRAYLQNYEYLTSDLDYRYRFITHMSNDPFFWILLLAHAWVMHSEFHVDCGDTGDLLFYPSYANATTDWTKPSDWKNTAPYDDIDSWRRGTAAGAMMTSVSRPFGRIMDDEWQSAIFTRELPDFPRATLVDILQHIAHAGDGRLGEMEAQFYRAVWDYHRQNAQVIGSGELMALVAARAAEKLGAAA